MKKFLVYLVLALLALTALLQWSLNSESTQQVLLEEMATVAQNAAARGIPEPDGLQVFVCGSSSPLPTPDRAQACLAVVTPSHFYVVDAGAGSTNNLMLSRLPMHRLQAILVTHHHSDHIAELYEMNLGSWVQGRPLPLQVYGPRGMDQVVEGINDTYELDRGYRIAHHGADLLPASLGVMQPEEIDSGFVLQDGDLKITAYHADHSPVSPALGYRFDYRGRSLVISGDSIVTDDTRQVTAATDLVFHDALSDVTISTMAEAATQAGQDRAAKILSDIRDYHASTESLLALQSQAKMVVYYHLVPSPRNVVMEKIFSRHMADNYRIAEDGDWFFLPAASTEIIVNPD